MLRQQAELTLNLSADQFHLLIGAAYVFAEGAVARVKETATDEVNAIKE